MAIIGNVRIGHTDIIPTSGYTEKIYTLSVRYSGNEKDINVARKFFEDDILNRHISAGTCQFIVADLVEA